MAKVKFVKAVKYEGVRFPAHTPFEVKDEELEALKAAGAIVLEEPAFKPQLPLEEPEGGKGKEETPEKPAVDMTALTKMTTNELKKFAADNNITVPANGAKADVFNAIVAALG
jgi:hypothetical protein